MSKINQNGNAPMNTLKPQPGQSNSYNPKFHPLPGEWAKQQMSGQSRSDTDHYQNGDLHAYSTTRGSRTSYVSVPGQLSGWGTNQNVQKMESSHRNGSSTSSRTEIQRALAAEQKQHEYWEEWQGVTPGKAIYENPRELQNTLLPSAKYGTEGRGYG